MVPYLVSMRGPPEYKLAGIGYSVVQPWSLGHFEEVHLHPPIMLLQLCLAFCSSSKSIIFISCSVIA